MARILIVEDDPQVSAVIAKLLDSHGHRTRVEPNGAAGLIAAHEDLPDLIIMDLSMPILEGQDAITALRQQRDTSGIPVVVLSARGDDQTLSDAIRAGANVYLVKPPDPHELLSVIGRLLAMAADEDPT
jgi:DNA-binding response OmpR family regulator